MRLNKGQQIFNVVQNRKNLTQRKKQNNENLFYLLVNSQRRISVEFKIF